MTHIQELRDVIRHLHGAKAKHLERASRLPRGFKGADRLPGWSGRSLSPQGGTREADKFYAWTHAH